MPAIDQLYNQEVQQIVGPVPAQVTSAGDKRLVAILDQKHPEYKLLRAHWMKLSLLYAGGWAIKENAELFLTRRPKELPDVYQARLANFTYENHLGTALDWYSSELFEEDPHIQSGVIDPVSGEFIDKKHSPDERRFWDAWMLDCDRAGTSFVDLFRKCFQNVLLYQTSYILIDLPNTTPNSFTSAFEQKEAGALDPYLSVYTPMEAINWSLDNYGNLDWIVFYFETRNSSPDKVTTRVDRWYFYDRQKFQIWERIKSDDEKSPPAKAVATLVSEGRHILASKNIVPVLRLSVPEGLWLANRAMLAAVSHLNTDNVLDWALFMAALCMPVIIGDVVDFQPTLSEAGFITLPQGSDYKWTEPAGTSFAHLSDRLGELTENIFRSFYLIHQGRSGRATPTAQSGVSKQLDMMPSKDILKMFGDLLRAFMQRVLNLVSQTRNQSKDIRWDIRGFEFKDDLSLEEVQTLTQLLAANVPSDLFEKEIWKRMAKSGLPDANPGTISQIFEQINEAPNKLDQQIQREKKLMNSRAENLGSQPMLNAAASFSKAVGQDAVPSEKDIEAEGE